MTANFCDFNFSDPQCQLSGSDPQSDPVGGLLEKGEDVDFLVDHFYESDPLRGNFTYLAIALFTSVKLGTQYFRYQSSSFYDNGSVLKTNTWESAGKLYYRSQFLVWTTLATSQLLSMFGYYGEANIKLWMWLPILETVLGFIVKIKRMFVIEQANKIRLDSTYSYADKQMALNMDSAVKAEM